MSADQQAKKGHAAQSRKSTTKSTMKDNANTEQSQRMAKVDFLTVAEVATLMRVSKMTVYRLVHSGELPAVRVGRSFRVPERAVHEYLDSAFIETA